MRTYSPSSIRRRIIKFQRRLLEKGVGGALVCSPDNLFYLSGHLISQGHGPAMLFLPVSGEPVLVIPEGESRLHSIVSFPGSLLPYSYKAPEDTKLSTAACALEEGYFRELKLPLGVEPCHLSLEAAGALGILSGNGWVNIEGDVDSLRMIKDEEEISLLKRAAAIADLGQQKAASAFRVGVEEIQLLAHCRAAMESAAGQPIELRSDVLFGRNTSRIGSPEGVAGRNRAARGECAIVDLLPRTGGYFADTTRTIWIDPVPSEGMRVVKLLGEVRKKLEKLLRPGVEAQAVDDVARTLLSAEGTFPHHTGHGIGISAFEPPYILPGSRYVLAEGMTITLEPGLYSEKWGARLEDDYLITAEGFVKLSGLGGR